MSHNAIPLADILASRGISLCTTCTLCLQGQESIIHTFFQCDFARACWFASPLSLLSTNLPTSFRDIIEHMARSLSDEQWTVFAEVIWSIWRCRNDLVYGAKKPSIQTFFLYLNAVSSESLIAGCHRKGLSCADNAQQVNGGGRWDSGQ